jgi:hypothetical protein
MFMLLTFPGGAGVRGRQGGAAKELLQPLGPPSETSQMPIKRMLDNAAFDPAAVTALTNAYEAACASLRLIDRTDPLAEIVAKKIIEHARRGERDPNRLREAVLKEVKSNLGEPKHQTVA